MHIFNLFFIPVSRSLLDPCYPFCLVFIYLIYKFHVSLSSTSVHCPYTTTEVSYPYSLLTTQADLYIVFSLAIMLISHPSRNLSGYEP